MATCRKLLWSTIAIVAFFYTCTATATGSAVGRGICDSCACVPDNIAPVTINCTCAKTKLLIVREQDFAVLSSVRELTLASCGFVSLPSTGLSTSTALTRVTVRDLKLFHYTAGLFPALVSLSVEDVGELVLDGFGSANRTLQYLTVRRTGGIRLIKGTVTKGVPLRRVIFDRVDVEEIESGALDMAFVGDGNDNGQSAAADGFTVVESKIKTVQSGGVNVQSGAVRILNSTLEDLASGAIVVDQAESVVRLSGNRFGTLVGDSVIVLRSAVGVDVHVDGNEFRTLPADMQLLKSEKEPVDFRDNIVDNVDLGPFLFDVGTAVRVSGNRFVCDCDPRRISVLKLNQVFPGLLPDADSRFAQLLSENYCRQPEDTALAGYRDLLVKEIVCKGTNVTTASPPALQQKPSANDPAANRGNRANTTSLYARGLLVFAASVLLTLSNAVSGC